MTAPTRSLAMGVVPRRVLEHLEGWGRGNDRATAFLYCAEVAQHRAARLRAALPTWADVFYAVKANSFPAVLSGLAREVEGFEVASAREADLAVRISASVGKRARLLAAGPGKSEPSLARLIELGVELVNVESVLELHRLARLTEARGECQRIALRIHPPPMAFGRSLSIGQAVTPFGFGDDDVTKALEVAAGLPGLQVVGFHFHVLCNNLDGEAHAEYVRWCLGLSERLATAHGVDLQVVDVGGGLGVSDEGEPAFGLDRFVEELAKIRPPVGTRVAFEPGRWLVDDCGYYVAEVTDLKQTRGQWFAVLRGGIHHFLRPASYQTLHNFAVVPVDDWPYGCPRPEVAHEAVTVVGELCTPADVLASGVVVDRLRAGDLVVFPRAGSYGWELAMPEFLGHPLAERVAVGAGDRDAVPPSLAAEHASGMLEQPNGHARSRTTTRRPFHARCPDGSTPYDEVYDEAGRRRAPYDQVARRLGWDPLDPPPHVKDALGAHPFGDDTPILPVPLALDDEECRLHLRVGVLQRARALQQFFADVVLGDGNFLRSGSPLTAALLDDILVSEGTSINELRRHWAGHEQDDVRFVYAPDLMREPGGRWLVIEDNVGCVTGCVDSRLVLDVYGHATNLDVGSGALPDLGIAVERWLHTLGVGPSDPGVFALVSDGPAAHSCGSLRFSEDGRRNDLMARLGIPILHDDELERCCSPGFSPLFKALINVGVPSTMEQWALLRDQAFGRLRVAFLNAPGTSVLGSKALLPFVGEMVRHYLDEELLLEAPRTVLARDGLLPADLDGWVLKTAAGCQGTGVFILPSLPKARLETIGGMLRTSWPSQAAVLQARVEPSRIRTGGRRGSEFGVELRPLAYILGWQDVLVGEHFLAKLAASDRADALNNISCGGAYAPVVRVRTTSKGNR